MALRCPRNFQLPCLKLPAVCSNALPKSGHFVIVVNDGGGGGGDDADEDDDGVCVCV